MEAREGRIRCGKSNCFRLSVAPKHKIFRVFSDEFGEGFSFKILPSYGGGKRNGVWGLNGRDRWSLPTPIPSPTNLLSCVLSQYRIGPGRV